MGKGFRATEGTLGQDLSELIMAPCRKRVSRSTLIIAKSATDAALEPACEIRLDCERLVGNIVVTCI